MGFSFTIVTCLLTPSNGILIALIERCITFIWAIQPDDFKHVAKNTTIFNTTNF